MCDEEIVMLNKQKIKSHTGSTTFSRGLELYHQDKVLQFRVDEDDEDNIIIQELVKGSGRKNMM